MACGSTMCEELPTHGGSLRIFVSHAGRAEPRGQRLAARAARRRRARRDSPIFPPICVLRSGSRTAAGHCWNFSPRQARRQERRGLRRGGEGQYPAQFLRSDPGRHLTGGATAIRTSSAKFLPGTHIPVVSPEALLRSKPDYVLISAVESAGGNPPATARNQRVGRTVRDPGASGACLSVTLGGG